MSSLPSNVLPPDANWSPTSAELSKWKSDFPNDVWKAIKTNPDWKDLNGGNASPLPVSRKGFAIWEWQVVGTQGKWVMVSAHCGPSCNPVAPMEVPGAMPLGMQIRKECR